MSEPPIIRMSSHSLLSICLAGFVVLAGCSQNNPAPQQTTAQKSVELDPANPEEGSTATLESEANEPGEQELVEEAVATPPPAQRILLLARGGPLLMDVQLTIEGRPIGQGIQSMIERVIQAGDTDGDGRSTWSEWRANEEFLLGEFTDMESLQQRTIKSWVESYDENDDGRIQRAEAASWLGRDGGRSASALRVRSRRSYLAQSAGQSRLWQILDEDADGRLTSQELDWAAERLFLLDTSDDRIVDQSELATLRDQLSGQSSQRTSFDRQARRDAAIHLRSSSDARDLDYLLSDLYAPRQQIGPTSFSSREELFKALDTDGDDELSASELGTLATLAPHLELAIDFGVEAESPARTTTLVVLEQSDAIERVLQTAKNRLVIETADSRLVISARDLTEGMANLQSLPSNQISLMVHDRGDALFECLDADLDGNLGEREITSAAQRIRDVDGNSNGQLEVGELPYSLTVAFIRGEAQGERSFYVPSIEPKAPGEPDSPTWFTHADLNGDGDISHTEFLGSPEQFQRLDKDRDEFISRLEAAEFGQSEAVP